MKWLLITTLGTNPGDEFARLGVQTLIREVDPEAQFDLLNKENPDHYEPREFDRAVICGMPLFWSTRDQDCQEIWWWERIFHGWIAADKRKLAAIGVGHVFTDRIVNLLRYAHAVQEVIDRTWVLTVREPILDHPQIVDSICPSSFAIEPVNSDVRFPLCNLMVDTGHFPHVCSEVDAWEKNKEEIVRLLHRGHYRFVAHNDAEHRLAHELGWTDDMISRFEKPEDYLKLYARAWRYFGNRLHGAAVCAAVKLPTWGVAYDSRIKMVQRLGGHACLPSQIDMPNLSTWLEGASAWMWPSASVSEERTKLTGIIRRFAYE